MEQIKKHPVGQLGNSKLTKKLYSNSSPSQKARLVKYFETSPRLSTLQARKELGILHPCGRIMELRKSGHEIDTHWVKEADSNGVFHRVGLYIYQGRKSGSYHE